MILLVIILLVIILLVIILLVIILLVIIVIILLDRPAWDRPFIHARVLFATFGSGVTEAQPNITVTESIVTVAIVLTITVRTVIQSFTDWIRCLSFILGIRDTCCARVHLSVAESNPSCTVAEYIATNATVPTITVVRIIHSFTDWISYSPFPPNFLSIRYAFKFFRLGLGCLRLGRLRLGRQRVTFNAGDGHQGERLAGEGHRVDRLVSEVLEVAHTEALLALAGRRHDRREGEDDNKEGGGGGCELHDDDDDYVGVNCGRILSRFDQFERLWALALRPKLSRSASARLVAMYIWW